MTTEPRASADGACARQWQANEGDASHPPEEIGCVTDDISTSQPLHRPRHLSRGSLAAPVQIMQAAGTIPRTSLARRSCMTSARSGRSTAPTFLKRCAAQTRPRFSACAPA
jgi:hypothetical protein